MTDAEVRRLRAGDVIREIRSGTLRIVLATSGDAAGASHVTLLMLRASWRRHCTLTTLNRFDLRLRFARTKRRVRVDRRLLYCCDLHGYSSARSHA